MTFKLGELMKIEEGGNLFAGSDATPEWELYLLYLANSKEAKSCEVPMGLEQWREWKREQEKETK